MRRIPLVYLRVQEDWLEARVVGRGGRWQGPPVAELDRRAFGSNDHGRLEDPEATRLLLHHTLRRLLAPDRAWKRLVRPRPDVVLHVPGDGATPEGLDGDTAAQELRELAILAGARSAHVWVGAEPSDADMLRGSFLNGRWAGGAPGWAAG